MKATLIGLALALTTTAALAGLAGATPQRGGGFNQGPAMDVPGNTPYAGRFVFIRLRYSFGYGGGRMRGGPPWSHDYPRGEVHFTKILNEITYVRPRLDGSNILSLDDPELVNFPVAYMAEPGYWSMTDKECESFRGVLPDARWIEIDDGKHPIWHSFFEIPNPKALKPHPTYDQSMVLTYWGIFEDNDPNNACSRLPMWTATSASNGNGPTPDSRPSISITRRTSTASIT
jgi:hypothetical protein